LVSCRFGPIQLRKLTKGQRTDINEKNTLGSLLTRENTTLNSGTVGNGLIGVDSLGRLLAVEVILEELLDLGDSGRTTNEDNLSVSYDHYRSE
jgi:hypothetical protein